MILTIDLEHDEYLNDAKNRDIHFVRTMDAKLKLEAITGDACLVQRYARVNLERLAEWGVWAVAISGNATGWEAYDEGDLEGVREIIRVAPVPIIGFCGGCQLIATTMGAQIGPMGPLAQDEPDPHPDFGPAGFAKEFGFSRVRITAIDPLFEGLSEEPVFFQAHYFELKEVPPEMALLAVSDCCRIQAIKRLDRPVYGTQFHPERYDDDHPDGRTLLKGFFDLARAHGPGDAAL
jgi:GMP synthase-like glutamine amidotransferase